MFPTPDADWESVGSNFKRENARTWLLRAALPVEIPYRLIARAEIQADDARLAVKYPGIWQRRPGEMEYAAVSAVGFNTAKTKALVYIRLRGRGTFHAMELRDGKWAGARGIGGCGWIA